MFYVPDIVYVYKQKQALKNIDLYIGDGASIMRPIIRRRSEHLFGHTPIRTQLTWCSKNHVPYAIFTHCGSQIVTGDERTLGPQVRRLGKEQGVTARIAHDGLIVNL